MLKNTDHTGLILSAGIKLKPIRRKIKVRDCRAHYKKNLYKALNEEDWNDVLNSNNIDEAVDHSERTIHSHFKLLHASVSSRDPFWVPPLVNCLQRAKSRISPFNREKLIDIYRRISEVIRQNE